MAGDLVEKIDLIDEFTNPKTNRSSKCYRITYRSMDRSLTNDEIDDVLRARSESATTVQDDDDSSDDEGGSAELANIYEADWRPLRMGIGEPDEDDQPPLKRPKPYDADISELLELHDAASVPAFSLM